MNNYDAAPVANAMRVSAAAAEAILFLGGKRGIRRLVML
jgi:hypothetical protein